MELLTTIALAVTLTRAGANQRQCLTRRRGADRRGDWSAATAKGETDIYASVSADGGTTFGAPVRVNSAAGTAKVNGEQAPRVDAGAGSGRTAAYRHCLARRRQDRDDAAQRAIRRRREDVRTVGDRAGQRRRRQSRLAVRGGRQQGCRARALARSSWHGGAGRLLRRRTRMARQDRPPTAWRWPRSRRCIRRSWGARAQPASITSGVCYCCKTALVSGAGWNLVRRVASGVSRRHPRHRVRRLERWRRHLLGARSRSATTTGS